MTPTKLVVKRTPGDWEGRVPAVSDVRRTVAAPFDMYDEDGRLLAFARRTPDEQLVAELDRRLPTYKYGRGRRSNGMISTSSTFGFMPREELRHPCCRAAVIHKVHPEIGAVLDRGAVVMGDVLAQVFPEQHRAQLEIVSEVKPRWRMRGDLYTSGIINYNNTLWYHRDKGNFSKAWNAMLVLRRGAAGGELVMPEYDVAVQYQHGDCIWSNAGEIVHGVTPILPQREGGYRISVVWYAMHAMKKCGTPEEELAHARAYKRRTAIARTSTGRTEAEKQALLRMAMKKKRKGKSDGEG